MRNKSRFFPLENGYRRIVQCRCNKCSECLTDRENDYKVRSYIEYKHAQKNNGFTYFETLTYDEDNVPRLHGLYCFNRKHYIDFIKRLRSRLERWGFDTKDRLHYFFVSEYGTKDGCTHRPHYHVLFYSSVDGLTPYRLRYAVRLSWKFGRIDKLKSVSSRIVNSISAINYVAKYVNKPQTFKDEFSVTYFRLKEQLTFALNKGDWKVYEMLSKQIKDLETKDYYRQYEPFHRQSNGFGKSVLDIMTYQELEKLDAIKVEDKKYKYKFYRIPLYIQRKLWYVQQKDTFNYGNPTDTKRTFGCVDGKYRSYVTTFDVPYKHWVLNDEGVIHKYNQIENKIKKQVQTYEDIITNLLGTNGSFSDLRTKINKILGKRNLYDFAVYKLFYQGTLHFKGNYDLYDIFDTQILPFNRSLYYVDGEGYIRDVVLNVKQYKQSYLNKYIVDENISKNFEGFDKIDSYFDFCRNYLNRGVQERFEYKQRKSNQLKVFTQ